MVIVASERCRLRGSVSALKGNGPVVYLVRRDIRVQDNWSLHRSFQEGRSVRVVHVLESKHPSYRLAWFYFKGLESFQNDLKESFIPLDVLNEGSELVNYLEEVDASEVVADLNTLREFDLKWVVDTCDNLSLPIWEVDSHNIVPVWVTSDRQEDNSQTLRTKINAKLSDWLIDFPRMPPPNKELLDPVREVFDSDDWLLKRWGKNEKPDYLMIMPGYKYAKDALDKFINYIPYFKKYHNDPSKDSLSGLSPWFRHGHISKQRVALEVKRSKSADFGGPFLEALIMYGELAENYTFYNKNYDTLSGGPEFGIKTLQDHAKDKREYLYSLDQLDNGETYDKLWNAAQYQLKYGGKIHGFMRTYWAKKILEWTDSPEKALEITLQLNDTYSLDGRDPRGYTGILYSIAGLHDEEHEERPIFGKVLYADYDDFNQMFDVDDYVKQQSCWAAIA